jgi:hypothetical protein
MANHGDPPSGVHRRVDATVTAGLLMFVVSLAWAVGTIAVAADILRDGVGNLWSGDLLTDPEGDARRGVFLATVVIGIQIGSLAISVAVMLRRWWGRWIAVIVAGAFGAVTLLLLAHDTHVVLVANLAILTAVTALLTGTLIAHRNDRIFLWGGRSPFTR